MSPLIYLSFTKLKNRFRELFKTPSELLTLIIFLALLVVTLLTNSSDAALQARSENEFFAIVFLLYSAVFILVGKKGFANGASMFSMADVNLIFIAPFKQYRVLSYGLFQQLGRSLSLGFIILYQAQTVKRVYGISFGSLICVLVGYVLVSILSQMLATAIYSLTCSSERISFICKFIFYAVPTAFLLYLFLITYPHGFSISSLVMSLNSEVMKFFPVSGIILLAVRGSVKAEWNFVLYGIIYFLACCLMYFLYTAKSKNDYYEDVLKATQISFSAITATKEGKVSENAPRNIRLGKTGITSGYGASVIREKHKIENRRSKVFLFNLTTIVNIILSTLYCFISQGSLIIVFLLSIYTLSLTITTGRWAKELCYPYVYLIPEKPAKKLLNLVARDFPSLFLESLLCCVPIYFIFRCSALEALSIAIARFSCGIMLIGINLVLQRIFGINEKKLSVLTAYFFLTVLFAAPTVAAGIFTGLYFPFNYALQYLAMALVSFLTSILLFFFSRNIIEFSEYNYK